MKKTLLFLLVLAAAFSVAYAASSASVGSVTAAFTDNEGNALSEELPGTFAASTGAAQPLTWTVEISGYGDFSFVLRENGVDARLSGMQTAASTYEVVISSKLGFSFPYTARVIRNGSTYNGLKFTMGEEFGYLSEFGAVGIVITGNGCTYDLGSVDLSGALGVLYPVPEGSVGFVFYDKGEYSDGWRYLEAAPADLKLVNGVPTVDGKTPGYDSGEDEFVFGFYRTSADGKNLFVNGETLYNYVDCTDKEVGSGMRNTELLVKAMGDSAYEQVTGGKTTAIYAAKVCADLVYTDEDGNVIDGWVLPSRDELNLMYTVLKQKQTGNFPDTYYDDYWSSTEYVMFPNTAWYQFFTDGDTYDGNRDYYFRVRPVRAF